MKKLTFFIKSQLEKEIRRLEATQPTDQLYTEHVFRIRSEIGKLENQLNVMQTRYGSVMSENTSLRIAIDHLLSERYSILLYRRCSFKKKQKQDFYSVIVNHSIQLRQSQV